MKYHQYLAVLLTGSLVACGGGGGGSSTASNNNPTTPTTTPSIASTTIAQGMVTGFGSVIVNGVHYDVKDANIDMDGDSQVESDLAVGQMVSISGTVDTDGIHGKAKKVSGESQLRGPIESIDLVAGVVVALGQSILITADTFYQDGLTAETLKVGDIIRVSSYTNADGKLVATRIEIKTGIAANDMRLAGVIANLDTTAMTFTINNKLVDYSKATITDLPNKTIENGLLVRVHGNITNDIFVAVGNVHLSPLDIKHHEDNDKPKGVEMSGLITGLVANTSFTLDGATVLINADTKFEGGTAADLSNGLLVKVRAKMDADKNLVAANIKLIFKPKVEDEGLVQTIDVTNNLFTLNGVTFSVTVDTSFHDGSKSKVRLFSLKDLAVGDVINVRGYKVAATGTTTERVVATRVERHNPPKKGERGLRAEVSGVIESVTGDMIKVAGHSIKVTENTQFGFQNIQAFLSGAVGLNVEIKVIIENNVLIAREIDLAHDDEDTSDNEHHNSSKSTSDSSKSVSSVASSKKSD